MVGQRLAHYEINAHLGSGGMGDVYRAIDTKLGRSVALKFLRDEVAAEPARIARFRREAQALASLNHPHIAAIHGLAKAIGVGDPDVPGAEDLHHLPTVTLAQGSVGIIVGTPAYMSPEQASGRPVDRRTDIFAFGSVLFEMLTGRRAFAGDGVADVVSRVLQRDPDWTLLPSSVPPQVERLLRLCLDKDPRQRRQSAGDVRVDLERAQTEPAPAAHRPTGRWRPAQLVATGACVMTLAALAVWAAVRDRTVPAPETRTQIVTPHTIDPMHFAVSPDGASLVFAAPTSDGVERLYVRMMNSIEARLLPGTEGARYPFWSPDSRSIGFFANRKLFRLDIAGGQPQPLAPAANPFGGAWGKDGTILFAPTTVSPLFRVPATGGKAVAATVLRAPRQTNHRGPSFLPDGRRFLFFAVAAQRADSGEPDESGVYLGSLDGGTPKRLTAADSAAVYFPPGRIVFLQRTTLVARQIDVERGELSGDPITVAEPVSVTADLGWFSVSATGLVAYRSGTAAPRRGTWFDRSGTVLAVGDDMNAPNLSRDQHFVAYDRFVGSNRDVWITDLVRGGSTPLTRHPAVDGHPVWSPDGLQVAFHSQRNGTFDIWKRQPGGGAPEELVLQTAANEWPLDWSDDGRFLLFERTDEQYASSDLLAVPMTGGDRTPIVIAAGAFEERMGNFSPDVRWVAYETDESGRPEVEIKPFQRAGGNARVSTNGGATPRWSHDGREIYFVAPDGKMMAVSISEKGSTLIIGTPVPLFATHISGQTFTFQYAVARDGRFLVGNRQVEQASAPPITILQHWTP